MSFGLEPWSLRGLIPIPRPLLTNLLHCLAASVSNGLPCPLDGSRGPCEVSRPILPNPLALFSGLEHFSRSSRGPCKMGARHPYWLLDPRPCVVCGYQWCLGVQMYEYRNAYHGIRVDVATAGDGPPYPPNVRVPSPPHCLAAWALQP